MDAIRRELDDLPDGHDRHAGVLPDRRGRTGDDIVRWGAGATWSQALERAVFGHDAVGATVDELSEMAARLGRDGLGIATVDLATPLLARSGVFRTSVQLVVATGWDGGGTRVR
jgi:hypothetical protein